MRGLVICPVENKGRVWFQNRRAKWKKRKKTTNVFRSPGSLLPPTCLSPFTASINDSFFNFDPTLARNGWATSSMISGNGGNAGNHLHPHHHHPHHYQLATHPHHHNGHQGNLLGSVMMNPMAGPVTHPHNPFSCTSVPPFPISRQMTPLSCMTQSHIASNSNGSSSSSSSSSNSSSNNSNNSSLLNNNNANTNNSSNNNNLGPVLSSQQQQQPYCIGMQQTGSPEDNGMYAGMYVDSPNSQQQQQLAAYGQQPHQLAVDNPEDVWRGSSIAELRRKAIEHTVSMTGMMAGYR
ncbi:hypothetical protein HELRODRAFT_162077 [Helobdella robusta]|uniref:Homeobox domain-containing protein n=1 Tax=Helobdella robusta TaxID=6412 RepID=T1ES82_HELRO|nr:hypothetical protein HELRODRAFT_162077 [Helobdella robusta]ESN98638.1 hypothetical protein HELRODRAFT_162077 [Helobdella robusta]